MINVRGLRNIVLDGAPLLADSVDAATLRSPLASHVVEPWERITGKKAVVISVDLDGCGDEVDESSLAAAHPECSEFKWSSCCRESWQVHLDELRSNLRTHWHRCDFGAYCAVVPVVFHNRCTLVLKYVEPATQDNADFLRNLELLDRLVLGFASRCGAQGGGSDPGNVPTPASRVSFDGEQRKHPAVRKTLRHIEEHLGQTWLGLAALARMVDLHPNYLSQLFTNQVSENISTYIYRKRMERAMNLLANTDWQIKSIAHEVGHANPNWFTQRFQVYAGRSPTEYREWVRETQSADFAS